MRRKLTGDHNQCASCGEYFNSTAAFDKHRIPIAENKPFPRRCRTVEEMLQAGMAKNSGDWWVTALQNIPIARSTACVESFGEGVKVGV